MPKRLKNSPPAKPKTKTRRRRPSGPAWAKDFGSAGMAVNFGPEVEHQVTVTPSEMDKFEAMYRARMAALGSKGGKIGGKRRLETMTKKQRHDAAKNAAAARWGKKTLD